MLINLYPALNCNLECKHCMHNCSRRSMDQYDRFYNSKKEN